MTNYCFSRLVMCNLTKVNTILICLWMVQGHINHNVTTLPKYTCSQLQVKTGTSIVLACPNYNTEISVEWLFKNNSNEEALFDGNKYNAVLNGTLIVLNNGYHLRIENITQVDEGNYTCITELQLTKFQVDVSGFTDTDITRVKETIKEGTTVEIGCFPRIHQKVIKFAVEERFNRDTSENLKYRIVNASRNTELSYFCKNKDSCDAIYLVVQYAPSVFIQLINETLHCITRGGNPPATIVSLKWELKKFNGDLISNIFETSNEKLNLTNFQQDDMYYLQNGNYICTVTYTQDNSTSISKLQSSISVEMGGAPACIQDSYEKQYGMLQQEAALHVEFYSFPKITSITWMKADKEIRTNLSIEKYSLLMENKADSFRNIYTSTLYIITTETNDIGNYTVKLSNIHGITTCTIEFFLTCEYNNTVIQLYILTTGCLTVITLIANGIYSRFFVLK
ncbi:neuronal growth regulator 1-like [Mytilus trossulus]|uniref:neuronal growth regulator 1-like n=1 Tax=Mytilus trossulus TaxID=6551 RepID=UPI003005364A